MLGPLTSPLIWGSFCAAVALAALLTPLVARLARRLGAVDGGGYRRVTRQPTPLMGGLAAAVPFLLFALAVVLLTPVMLQHWAWFWRRDPASLNTLFALSTARRPVLYLLAGAVMILAVGMVDDVRGIRARTKLAGELVAALFLCGAGFAIRSVDLPLLGVVNLGVFWGYVATVIWIVGVTNAFNLIDGVDGLATGVGLIATLTFVILGAQGNHFFVMLTGAWLAGGLLGFLGFNFPPARIYLGDTGSLFIGYVLAGMTLMGSGKTQAIIVLAPVLILGIPILETLVSIIRRVINGRPIFAPDDHHTHHRLLQQGLSPRRAALFLYLVAICMGGATILHSHVEPGSALAYAAFGLYGLTILAVGHVAGYGGSIRRMGERLSRRQENASLWALSRYAVMTLGSHQGSGHANEILRIVRKQARLTFIEARFAGVGEAPIGVSGAPTNGTTEAGPLCHIDVRAACGRPLTVQYQFDHKTSEVERDDVAACLNRIFEQAPLRPGARPVAPLQPAPGFGIREGGPRRRVMCVVADDADRRAIAPLMAALAAHVGTVPLLVQLGGQGDGPTTLRAFGRFVLPEPDVILALPDTPRTGQTVLIMQRFEPVLLAHQPDVLVVVGDSDRALACSLVATRLGIALAHIGAGMRTPRHYEAGNGVLIDAVSDILFCARQADADTLRSEGLPDAKLFLVGELLADTVHRNFDPAHQPRALKPFGLAPGRYVRLGLDCDTIFGGTTALSRLADVLEEVGPEMPAILPLPDRLRDRLSATPVGARLARLSNLTVVTEPPFVDSLHITAAARMVLTDSPVLEVETLTLGVPCLSLVNGLAEATNEAIVDRYRQAINGNGTLHEPPPLWDGKTAARIASILVHPLGGKAVGN